MAHKKDLKDSSFDMPLLTNDIEHENQMIYLAEQTAKKQLKEGTASPSVIVHYLRLKQDRQKANLELEILKSQNENLKAKTQSIKNAETSAALYEEALKSLKVYSGEKPVTEDV